MNREPSVLRLALAVLPLGFAAAATAQTTNQADAVASPALPIPAAPVITLPRPTPTPTPAASPTVRPSAARAAPVARPAARAARSISRPPVTPSPTPTSAASPTPTPSARPSPVAMPGATPTTPIAAASPVGDLARTPGETEHIENPTFWAGIVVLLLALAAAGFLGWRWREARRRRHAEEELARQPHVTVGGVVAAPPPPETPASTGAEAGHAEVSTFWTPSRPADPAAASDAEATPEPPPPPERPRLTISLHPRRAGVNLVSATADLELTVRNEGDGPAEQVSVALRLLAGRAKQDEELGEIFGSEQARPIFPPFTLAPGEERVCRTTAVLPRAEIEPIPVKNRPMFVPLVAADVRYLRLDGGRGQTAAAFVIGAPRAESDKLSPFWLDVGAKMRDAVEARPYGLEIES